MCSDWRRTGSSQSMPSQARSSIDAAPRIPAGSGPGRCPRCGAGSVRRPRGRVRSRGAPSRRGRDEARRSAMGAKRKTGCTVIVRVLDAQGAIALAAVATGKRNDDAHHRERSGHRRGPRLARQARPSAEEGDEGRRRGAAPPPPDTASPALPASSSASSFRRRAPRRSGAASPRPSPDDAADRIPMASDDDAPRHRPVGRRRSGRSAPSPPLSATGSISRRWPSCRPRRRTAASPRSRASARGPRTSISSSASAMPTSFRPATSRSAMPSPTPSARSRRCRSTSLPKSRDALVAVAGRRRPPVLGLLPGPPPARRSAGLMLDGPRIAAAGRQADALVVFLHGYGADGNDLIDLGRRLGRSACPAPPSPRRTRPTLATSLPSGRQWFSLSLGFDLAYMARSAADDGAHARRIPRCRARPPWPARGSARAGRLQPGHHDGALCRAAPQGAGRRHRRLFRAAARGGEARP